MPVLENGKEVLRDVTVGINNKVNAQITSGLAEGEQVILGMPGQSATSSGRRMGPQGIRF